MSAKVGKEHIDVWGHTNNVCYVQWMQDVVGHSEAIGWDSKRYLDRGAIWWFVVTRLTINVLSCLGNIILAQT